ncbi:MAG: hypothetical protein FWH59_01410 [Lentimicrobiaceae bacterium]|nr:hypothetical protein [Lentimicrobiaceae bacterium]
MKKLFKISILTAILGIALMGCKDPDDNGGSNGGNNGGGGINAGNWPAATLLAKYGLDGLNRPTGASNVIYAEQNLFLAINFEGNASTASAVKNYFNNSSNGWTEESVVVSTEATVTSYSKESENTNYAASFTEMEKIFQISVTKYSY